MARKSLMKITSIYKFFPNDEKMLEKGENAITSGHVKSFLYDADWECLRGTIHASMKDKLYTTEIYLKDGEVEKASCQCPRGLVKCHHMAALLLHAYSNVSITDQPCAWSRKDPPKEELKTIKELFPPKKPFKATKKVSDNLKGEAFKLLKEKDLVVGFTWLLNPAPPSTVSSPLVITPRDILFSKEYKNAPDPLEFFKDKIKISEDEVKNVANATKGQSGNWQWSVLRSGRLTSSNFGAVISACRRNRFPPSLYKRLFSMYNLDGVKSVEWGKTHEKDAVAAFEERMNVQTEETGLWLHPNGYLGATPDRLVHLHGDVATVEVKCPYKYRNAVLSEVLVKDDKYIVQMKNGVFIFRKEHDYYHQIQGQIHLANCPKGYLVLWTLKELLIFLVEKDPSWTPNIEILSEFYVRNFLPQIVKKP